MADEISLILGPAGVRQAEERARIKLFRSMFQERPGVRECTSNSYDRHVRIVNCVVEPEDPSFIDLPWKSTIEYLTEKGEHTGGWTLLKELHQIKPKWRNVPFIVAVIHKMEPNGLGDAMVILKDPTWTIQASIHRSIIADNRYGPHIKEGSVLLLKEVVVVKFERAPTYLNIVLNNITNVICKENMATSFIQESGPSGVNRNAENWLNPKNYVESDDDEETE
ncbi:hypothetical protein V5N11_002254 [Cardamine amara subsp. amara]|uniref:Homologous recombination OB-fold protein OB-fold domain-containing protein n=1 Tax=Cardamine amara subsp. amara TaxID=228776 RepID=A0ABD1ACT4_CARAN